MSVRNASPPDMSRTSASHPEIPPWQNFHGNPRLYRGFLWPESVTSPVTPSATLSETLRPLPVPPESECTNLAALRTIALHPELFHVVTPIHVDRFEAALAPHPNRPLVQSVVHGLREGFWPMANFEGLDFPEIWDEENYKSLSEEELAFVEEYAKEEEAAGRYSAEFGPDLLPGMFSMPMYPIPKPGTDKMRLVNDHSAGKFALNSGISKDDVGMRQDNIQDLGTNLLHARAALGSIPLWLFKSDVTNAYRLLPMHPLYQIKQVISIGHRRRIDRCCCFGSRGSPDLWCTFMSLILWIAIHVKGIPELLAYMDDTFSHDTSLQLVYYPPYNKSFPSKQVSLLRLWDELGILHKQPKQVFGRSLTIIGLHVNSDAMTVTLPDDSRCDLVKAIRAFVSTSPRKHSLQEWQRLLGWINWGLNVRPLLRPALQSSYEKLRGKSFPRAGIYLNVAVRRDLMWVADMFESGDGIHFFTARSWRPEQADLTVFCDASLSGMGFWSPQLERGFTSAKPSAPMQVEDNIFWYEALTVAAAVQWAASLPSPPHRLTVYTDNLNSVQMFNSLHGRDIYNDILRFVCGIMTSSSMDIRVCHIPGTYNVIADALSRDLLDLARTYRPCLRISPFTPPRVTLGDVSR